MIGSRDRGRLGRVLAGRRRERLRELAALRQTANRQKNLAGNGDGTPDARVMLLTLEEQARDEHLGGLPKEAGRQVASRGPRRRRQWLLAAARQVELGMAAELTAARTDLMGAQADKGLSVEELLARGTAALSVRLDRLELKRSARWRRGLPARHLALACPARVSSPPTRCGPPAGEPPMRVGEQLLGLLVEYTDGESLGWRTLGSGTGNAGEAVRELDLDGREIVFFKKG